MSLKITSNQSGFGDYVTYRTIVRDASGIFPKTPIKVAGINAGRIKNIELIDNNALITFEILERVKVGKDAKLKIKTVGFLGDKYLEILVGSDEERLSDMTFVVAEEGGGVENLVKDAEEVLKDVKAIAQSMRESLAPEGAESPMKKIVGDIEQIASNTKSATASINRLMAQNEERLNNLIANFEKFSKDLAYQADKENQDSAMADVKRILANAEKVSADLKSLMENVKAGKGTVGKLLVEEQIADEVQQTLASVRKIVDKVDSIRTELAVFTGANTNYGSETDASLKIFPSPERFYLLGITTSKFGPESERHSSSTVNGVTTTEIRKEKQKDELRFTVMLGRKIQNWVVRGGLIQSSGGVGVDYDRPDWGAKFSLDVYDYRDEIGPNVRFSTEAQVWNVIYAKLAFEDIVEENRSATISAGLKFTDEDLKGLLGFFL
jgi:phospholipid/cholesterol/gamma-HCH transport system substrate-binding protein